MLEDIANAVGGSVTETHSEGYFERLLKSVVGAIIGICLFLLSFVVLWWNEGNVIAEKNALNEMQSALVEGKADAPNKSQNNKLVHATGKLSSEDKVGDAPYLKSGPYLTLERHVEMFQWIEKATTNRTKSVGGSQRTTTTYSYSQGWSETYNDSSTFKNPAGHSNPHPDVQAVKVKVKKSHFGKFDGAALLDHYDAAEPVHVTESMLLPLKDKDKKPELRNDHLYVRKHGGSGDQIGDQRISWKAVKAGPFSVIAKQTNGNKFAPYVTKNERSEFLIAAGAKPAKAMIESAKDEAGSLAMFLRVVGFFMMWIGLNLVSGPLTTFLDFIPFLGSAGRFVLAVVFFLASLVLTLVTIVLSMIAHHPVVAILFLLAAGGAGYYLYDKKKKGKARAADTAAQEAHVKNAEEVTEIGAAAAPSQPPKSGGKARSAAA